MNRIWKTAVLAVSALLVLCALAGCTPKETGPKFETAFVISNTAQVLSSTQCLVDGDPTSDAVARIEIQKNDINKKGAVYTELVAEYGLGLPALSNENGTCVVFSYDKRPVILVKDWEIEESEYYVIPAQSEEEALQTLWGYMKELAKSQGIDE